MPDHVPSLKKNYLRTTLEGSFWNILQFVTTFIVGTIVSVLLTRHFGAQTYGLLAYLIWFSTVTQLVLNFGLLATTQTWVPKYYFTGELPRAAFVARQLLKMQLIIAAVGTAGLVAVSLIWHRFVSFSTTEFTRLMIINILPIISTLLLTFFSTLLVALQRFKQSARIYIAGQILSLLVVITVIRLDYDIGKLLLLLGAVNVLLLGFFIYASRDIIHQLVDESHGESAIRTMMKFSGWAYLNSLLTIVIWDKSAFFFLGKFHSGQIIAIYGIAYTLAATVTSMLDPIVSVLTTMLAELVAKKDWERIRLIIRLCAKYISLLLLPLATLAYALSPYIVRWVYGPEFLLVASIFPWLLFSATINRVFAPAWSIPQYMNGLHQVVPRNLAVAVLNIVLGSILIPRFGIWGAVISTMSTQLAAFVYFNFFIRRYQLRLFTLEYAKVLGLNLCFFALVFLTVKHQAPFIQSLVMSLVGVVIYGLFVVKKMMSIADRQLLSSSIMTFKKQATV